MWEAQGYSLSETLQDMIALKQDREEYDTDLSRRNFLYLLGIGGAGLLTSQHFQCASTKPFPRISEASIDDLSAITNHLRTLQRQGDVPIFNELTAHLSVIQNALNATMDDRQRHDLWRILAQIQLIGRLSPFAKRDLAKAKMFAAQEYALKSIDCALATNNLYIIPRFVPLAHTIQQKYPSDSHASTIIEYALSVLYAQERV